MKYFTFDWWAGAADDAGAAISEYHRYLDFVRDVLPVDLRRLSEDISLHDARLRRSHLADGTLEFHLDGYRFDGSLNAYSSRRICLTYREVCMISSTADPEKGLGGPHGYGDLGYDEVDVVAGGGFEHRLLFSSGIELHVRFADFSLWYEDVAD